MIDKNSLKINNIVWYENTRHIIKELHSDKVLHLWSPDSAILPYSDGYYTDYNVIDPVEISDEELEKIGFIKGKDCFKYNNFVLYNSDKNRYSFFGHQLIYIHQLQNLYYSIYNEELIKEKGL